MASIDETGITPVDLQGYKILLEEQFREEFGETLSVDPETPNRANHINSRIDVDGSR